MIGRLHTRNAHQRGLRDALCIRRDMGDDGTTIVGQAHLWQTAG